MYIAFNLICEITFISDAKNSSIPAAFFEIKVENTTSENVKYQVALSVANPYENSKNKAQTNNGYKTLTLFNSGSGEEEIEYKDNKLYINDKEIEDPYGTYVTYDFDKLVIPKDTYYVLGDNRTDSVDSRILGVIPKEKILGKK